MTTKVDWSALGELGFEACGRAALTVARSNRAVEEDDAYQEAVLYYGTHADEMRREEEYGRGLPGSLGGERGALKAVQRKLVFRLREWAAREGRAVLLPLERPRQELDASRWGSRPTPPEYEGKPYTPAIVEATLPRLYGLPAEAGVTVAPDPDMPRGSVDPSHGGTWMAHVTDVRRAFQLLAEAQPDLAAAAFLTTVIGMTQDAAAELLGIAQRTVGRRADAAITSIADYLNGDEVHADAHD